MVKPEHSVTANSGWVASDDLRPADHVEGARIGFVVEEFDVGDGLRHLERILLLFALWLLKHHQQRVTQILQTSRRIFSGQDQSWDSCL